MNTEYSKTLQSLDSLLRSGRGKAATEAFQSLVLQSEDHPRLGQEIGALLLGMYNDFEIAAAVGFVRWMKDSPAEEVSHGAMACMEAPLASFTKWRRVVNEVSQERITRDLRDSVRSRDISAAVRMTREVFNGASEGKQKIAQAKRIGVALGSLNHDRPRVDKMLKVLGKDLTASGLEDDSFDALTATVQSTRDGLAGSDVAAGELQYNRMHTEAVVQVIRALPGDVAVREPSEEQLQKAYDAMFGLLAAYFFKEGPKGPRPEIAPTFYNVVRILREFSPTEPKSTGSVQGIEDVAFLKINAVDKLTSVRALRLLGKKKKLVSTVLKMLDCPADMRGLDMLVRLMGGFSSAEFYKPLSAVLTNKKYKAVHSTAVESLGRIGDPRSLNAVEKRLQQQCKKHPITPPQQREILHSIAAIGRISKHPDTSESDRNAIVLRNLKMLPEERTINLTALQHLCAFRPGKLSEQARQLTIRRIVSILWSKDTKSELQQGDDSQRTELGFREPMVNILNKMGKDNLPLFLKEVEPRVMQYSGGFWAFGEALVKIGDERAVPMVGLILNTVLRTDESRIPEHLHETFYDAASQKNTPISRDKIAHSLIYALRKTGGAEGRALIQQVTRQIQEKRFPELGPQSAALLGEILADEKGFLPSKNADGTREATMTLDELPSSETSSESPSSAATGGVRADDSIKALIKDIEGRGLFKTKKEKRITAIQEVASRREISAILPLARQLDNEDVIIKSACQTALQEMIRATDPPAQLSLSIAELLSAYRKIPRSRIKPLHAFIDRLKPEKEPFKKIILDYITTEKDNKAKSLIAEIFYNANVRLGEDTTTAAPPIQGMPTVGKDTALSSENPAKPGGQHTLEIKRLYFAERKAWIAGGKQGDPPKPPK